jgi:hypothetical protein
MGVMYFEEKGKRGVYDGEFVDDKRVGKSLVKFEDGSEYLGRFVSDEMEGSGIYTDKIGNKFMTFQSDDDKKYRKDSKVRILLSFNDLYFI